MHEISYRYLFIGTGNVDVVDTGSTNNADKFHSGIDRRLGNVLRHGVGEQ